MRWIAIGVVLLLPVLPAAAQDGCDSGIDEDSKPTGPEEQQPKKPSQPAPEREPERGGEAGDGFRAPTAEEINRAIDRGVAWLKKAQREDGSWGPCVAMGSYDNPKSKEKSSCYDLGPTAFSLFALGTCGVPRDDPAVRKGLAWIQKAGGGGYDWTSYETSAVILALTALNGTKAPSNAKSLPRSSGAKPPKGVPFRYEDWSILGTRVQSLLSYTESGGFRYWSRGNDRADVSATQFGILALRAASFAGYPVEKTRPDVWANAAKFLEAAQERSGGFPYHKGGQASRGMTAAGVSTLVICREQMGLKGEKTGGQIDGMIEDGLDYLDKNFSLDTNPSPHFEGHDHYHYCHLYAIERTGILSGKKELGGKDWYVRGAAWLLDEQATDGHWHDKTCMEPKDTLGTCFALLFLKRATPAAVTTSAR